MAYLTPGIRNAKGRTRKLRSGHHRQLTDTTTNPCADRKTPRIDVPFFVAPADARAAEDIVNLLEGTLGGEIGLRFAGLEFDRTVLCDVQYGPTTLDASFFVPPAPAPADDDVAAHGGLATINSTVNHSGEAQAAALEVMGSAHAFFGSKLYLFVAIGAGGGGLLLLGLVGWWLWKRWRGETAFTPKRQRTSNTMAPAGATATARMQQQAGGPGSPGSADNVSVLTEGTASHAHSSHHRRAGSFQSQAAPPLQLPAAAVEASQPIGAEEASVAATEQG